MQNSIKITRLIISVIIFCVVLFSNCSYLLIKYLENESTTKNNNLKSAMIKFNNGDSLLVYNYFVKTGYSGFLRGIASIGNYSYKIIIPNGLYKKYTQVPSSTILKVDYNKHKLPISCNIKTGKFNYHFNYIKFYMKKLVPTGYVLWPYTSGGNIKKLIYSLNTSLNIPTEYGTIDFALIDIESIEFNKRLITLRDSTKIRILFPVQQKQFYGYTDRYLPYTEVISGYENNGTYCAIKIEDIMKINEIKSISGEMKSAPVYNKNATLEKVIIITVGDNIDTLKNVSIVSPQGYGTDRIVLNSLNPKWVKKSRRNVGAEDEFIDHIVIKKDNVFCPINISEIKKIIRYKSKDNVIILKDGYKILCQYVYLGEICGYSSTGEEKCLDYQIKSLEIIQY